MFSLAGVLGRVMLPRLFARWAHWLVAGLNIKSARGLCKRQTLGGEGPVRRDLSHLARRFWNQTFEIASVSYTSCDQLIIKSQFNSEFFQWKLFLNPNMLIVVL